MSKRPPLHAALQPNALLLEKQHNFQSLSVRDLIEARDQYHYHLMSKANVVGTAIGLYLCRSDDQAALKHDAKPKKKAPRRFDNSEVRSYSWPCVLVLVREWIDETAFGGKEGKHRAYDMVPQTLYLSDGRVVPVCVVQVTPQEQVEAGLPFWQWPDSFLGAGMPIQVDVQGETRVATAGCLVTDGHTTYVLSNRHVCGPAGTPVFTLVRGKRVEIGRSSSKQLTRLPFSEVYPSFSLKKTFSNLDVGLIELDDVNDWTSQLYGFGPIGPLADLSDENLSLRLIDTPVVAYGAHSGRLNGTIKALFYRFKTVGGFEYVSDFLIAPDAKDGHSTSFGDSGAVWHLAPTAEKDVPLPLAVEWGGQAFANGAAETFNFAVATTLSNVLRILDVELVQEHNTGVLPYWGKTGHYSIASFACDLVGNGKLGTLMKANLERISFAPGELDPDKITAALKAAAQNNGLVPLADVPDIVWKNFPSKVPGGRDNHSAGQGRSTGPEHPTHFADIDESRPGDGKTLRALSLEDPDNNLTVAFWQQFFDDCGHTSDQPTKRGLLPFRVWQFYKYMVQAVADKKMPEFVCAAGIMAHYVGDACQPLHGSIFADGFADQEITVIKHHRDGPDTEETSHVGAGVHSAYESNMIDRHTPDLLQKIGAEVAQMNAVPNVDSGFKAALATVELMDRSAKTIPPTDLINSYVAAGGGKRVAVYDALWDEYGDKTARVMADGALVLAMLWKSAWAQGNGQAVANNKLVAISESKLIGLYTDPDFVPSLDLDHVQPEL